MYVTTLETLTDGQEAEIWAFLENHPHNTVFQSPAFFRFYATLRHFKPVYFLLYNPHKKLEALMLAVIITENIPVFRRLSARCVVYGGPLLSNENLGLLEPLLTALNNNMANSSLFTQFRNFRQWDQTAIQLFEKHGYSYRDRLNLLLDTGSKQQLLSRMSASRRRQLQKALASGVEIHPAKNTGEVRSLYSLLKTLYQKKVRKPLPGLDYFTCFFDQMVSKGHGAILLVWFNNQIIGGIVAPVTKGKTIAELYIAGLDKEYPKQYPSVAATWAALAYAADNGIAAFDFMGLGLPDVPYGVRDFKLRFGGQPVNYGRFGRRNAKWLYLIAETGYNLLRMIQKV